MLFGWACIGRWVWTFSLRCWPEPCLHEQYFPRSVASWAITVIALIIGIRLTLVPLCSRKGLTLGAIYADWLDRPGIPKVRTVLLFLLWIFYQFTEGVFTFKLWVPFEFLDVSYVSRQNVQLVTNCPNIHAKYIQTKVHFDNNVLVYMYSSSWKSMFLVTFNPIMMIL